MQKLEWIDKPDQTLSQAVKFYPSRGPDAYEVRPMTYTDEEFDVEILEYGQRFQPERALARNTDPATSHEAAAKVNVTARELAVLHALKHESGTWDEITERTGLRAGTVSPRFRPLRSKGMIEGKGSRPGSSGRRQQLWHITAKGYAYVREHPLPEGEESVRKISLVQGGGETTEIGLTPDMLRAVTDEQWKEVLGERMYKNMKGYVRNRAIMLIRLLTEGRAYLDDQDKKWGTTKGEKR